MRKILIKADDKYNRLTAIKFSHRNKHGEQHWLFRCNCGIEKTISVWKVKNNIIKSCGCLRKEIKHGMIKTKTYNSWVAMKQRCLNKNAFKYKSYGARGITICPEWLEFENFYRDMGERPENKTLDRIDNNKNYYKENCCWSSPKQQSNNTRANHLLTYKGKTQTMKQWSEELRINYYTLQYRAKSGQKIL